MIPLLRLGSSLLLFVALTACDRAPAARDALPPSSAPSSASTMPPASSPSSETTRAIKPLRTLGTFTNRYRFRHVYLLVPEGLSDAQLIALAQGVHAKEKDAWLWLLDSDSQASEFLAALPLIERGESNNFPKDWFAAHTRAYSVLEFLPKGAGRRWALYRGPHGTQDLLSALPCMDGAGGCTQ